jgi:hypothetical protein
VVEALHLLGYNAVLKVNRSLRENIASIIRVEEEDKQAEQCKLVDTGSHGVMSQKKETVSK